MEANILMRNPDYLASKEAFVGKIIEGAEALYDKMVETNYIKQD